MTAQKKNIRGNDTDGGMDRRKERTERKEGRGDEKNKKDGRFYHNFGQLCINIYRL